MSFRKFKRNMLQIEAVVGGLTIFLWIGFTIWMLTGFQGEDSLLPLLSIPIGGIAAGIVSGVLIGVLRLTTIIVKYFK